MSNLGLAITSLFSGVGALDYGLELSGLGRITSQVEIDSYCQGVLERHFPAARRFKDIKHVGGNEVKAEVFCGGFPCQGVSRAGSGRGLDDDRSGLWREYARRKAKNLPSVGELVYALHGGPVNLNWLDSLMGLPPGWTKR